MRKYIKDNERRLKIFEAQKMEFKILVITPKSMDVQCRSVDVVVYRAIYFVVNSKPEIPFNF